MFDTHKLNDSGLEAVKAFKTTMAAAAKFAAAKLPDGREKSIFMTKLEEAMFFGTKAIAADPANHTEVTTY